ncbi:HEAT repeat domain-containing protein [Siphonobacter sp.]|uniref:HEAT repeat domain-containing protein n=1 Tax=Siphonobacter sp. TaxID=1869184 RepID=UPI003B3BAD18
MEKDTVIIDYLLGRLPESERLAFEQQLDADLPLKQEADGLQKIWYDVQQQEVEPDPGMDTSFYALLDREKENQALEKARQQPLKALPRRRSYWPYAAVLAAFGLMFWLGRLTVTPTVRTLTVEKKVMQPLAMPPSEEVAQVETPKTAETKETSLTKVQQEVATLRKELKVTQELVVLGLLRKESAAERLKGLQYASHLPELKPEVLRSLVRTLRQDENINVRLAAIETLRAYGQNPKVREAFLARLETASEIPEQLSVMETLVGLRMQEALPQLKHLTEDETVDPLIRQKAQQSIQLLTI